MPAQLIKQLVNEVESATSAQSVPDVDPDNATWDDVFRWGEEVARRGLISKEGSRALLKEVRELARRFGHVRPD